ncbi:MAG: HTH domain-containing protein [Eubacterium sp.]
MKGKLSTFERRIEILFVIINSEKVTLSELSKRYSVHKNTVYNDITYLSRYAPIRTRSGVNGGIFMMENYHNKLFRYLSYDEEKLLTSIMDSLDVPERNIVNNIINKFSMPKSAL